VKTMLLCAQSLNGFIARGESDPVNWTSGEDKKLFKRMTSQPDTALVMGRRTYELLPPPARSGEVSLPGRFLAVMTRHPERFEKHPARLFWSEGPQDLLRELQSRGFERCYIVGGTQTNTLFLQHRLLQEIYLTVEPVLFSGGLPLFSEVPDDVHLHLLETRPIYPDAFHFHYRVGYTNP